MSVNVHAAFAVPMGEAFNPDAAQLNPELAGLIVALEQQGEGYRNPHPLVHQPKGLFESEFEFFGRQDACVQQLRSWVWSQLGAFLRDVNPNMGDTHGLRIASQTWFHVTRDGGYFGYHNHPMASWSGVYCVDDGNPSPDIDNNGCLVFPHPQMAANTFLDPANAVMRWPFSTGNFVLKLSPGQLVLFPSWLGHYVTPFHGTGTRITIAFNSWFDRD